MRKNARESMTAFRALAIIKMLIDLELEYSIKERGHKDNPWRKELLDLKEFLEKVFTPDDGTKITEN